MRQMAYDTAFPSPSGDIVCLTLADFNMLYDKITTVSVP